MLNIIDRYEQISFETTDNLYKYAGTCNIKEGTISSLDVTIYEKDNNYLLGNMSAKNPVDGGISVNIHNSSDLSKLLVFAEILKNIKNELDKQV